MTRPGSTDEPTTPAARDGAAAAGLPDLGTLSEVYTIESELDAGAMGRVFVARQRVLDRVVALKIMSEPQSEAGQRDDFRARFLLEARSLATLSHPNIVTIYDSGELPHGLVFIAMELLRGSTLAAALDAEGQLPLMRALDIAAQMARGLRAAHQQGIVHRDIKPSNVFLVDEGAGQDLVKIFDFGIAKAAPSAAGGAQHVTRAGLMIGTPPYMAPEQIECEPVDGRTDLYALGCILYLMITGRSPFARGSAAQTLLAHLDERPPPPSSLRPEIPDNLDALVMRLIARAPADRFASADDALDALRACLLSVLRTTPDEASQAKPLAFTRTPASRVVPAMSALFAPTFIEDTRAPRPPPLPDDATKNLGAPGLPPLPPPPIALSRLAPSPLTPSPLAPSLMARPPLTPPPPTPSQSAQHPVIADADWAEPTESGVPPPSRVRKPDNGLFELSLSAVEQSLPELKPRRRVQWGSARVLLAMLAGLALGASAVWALRAPHRPGEATGAQPADPAQAEAPADAGVADSAVADAGVSDAVVAVPAVAVPAVAVPAVAVPAVSPSPEQVEPVRQVKPRIKRLPRKQPPRRTR